MLASEQDHVEQKRRVRQFLVADMPANAVGLVLIGVVWNIYPLPDFWLLFTSVAANFGVLLLGVWLADRGHTELPAVLVCLMMWFIALVVGWVVPPLLPVVSILCVLPVVIALPYLGERALLAMCGVGAVVAAGAGAIAWRGDPAGVARMLPSWITLGVQNALLPVFTGLVGLLVFQYSRRLHGIIKTMQESNRKLTESERHLERKVEERTQELMESRDQALEATRAKSAFLANMSHELRTPLNAIIGYSEMLEEELDEEGQHRFLPDVDKVKTAGKHLLSLINSILDLSKIEAGRMELFVERFALAPLLEETRVLLDPLARRNGNELVLEAGDLGEVRADQVKLRQILFNLLSNANKFTDHGRVTLKVRRLGEGASAWMVFEVRDTGIGMTSEQQARLFEPFQQADASTTKKYGGTGLGLTISRHFCELMGGSLSVSSQVGEGSTFTVRLPAFVGDPRETSAPRASPPPHEQAAPTGPYILVIDDDEAARDHIRRTLTREGFSIDTAPDGETALQMARARRPSVITLDVHMPGLDGWQTLAALKRDPLLQDVPVVLVTVVEDKNRGLLLGASDVLTKPVERETLARAVARYRRADPRRALVVDDEEAARAITRRHLEADGWTVEEASGGAAALDRLAEGGIDLVLLDLLMPDKSGFEVVAELRAGGLAEHLPIIVLTSADLTEEERDRLTGEVTSVLQKAAVTPDELKAHVLAAIPPSGQPAG